MSDWNENKYESCEEHERCLAHDCINESDQCDFVHPNIAKNVIAQLPTELTRQSLHPKQYRKWLQSPKVIINYTNKHTLKNELFNMSEIFVQMNTASRLNIMNNMFLYLLDDNEKSMFLADIMGNKNGS